MLVCLHLFVRASVCACVCLSVCLYASLSVCVCRLVCLHVCVSCQSKFGTGALRPSIVKELYSRIAARNQLNCRGSNPHSRMTHYEGVVSLTPCFTSVQEDKRQRTPFTNPRQQYMTCYLRYYLSFSRPKDTSIATQAYFSCIILKKMESR